jgi:TonB-dependent SusC/RagA subfamily outer membrane receptor
MEDQWGKPIPNAKVSLLSVSRAFFITDTIADANGHFVFKHFPVNDSIHYIIQATDKKVRKITKIELDGVDAPKLNPAQPVSDGQEKEIGLVNTYLAFADNFHKEQIRLGFGKNTIVLSEVQIKEKKALKYLKNSSNLNGAGNANGVITADQLSPGCPVLLDCIAGRLHGITFVGGTPYYGNLYGHQETMVMIDGVEVIGNSIYHTGTSKADLINTLSVSDIASIEIITDASLAAVYGVRGGGGVILINTKRWDDVMAGLPPPNIAFANYTPRGYYKAHVFYAPRYDDPKPAGTLTDLRTTIYWDPDMITDKNGAATIDFFNADTKGVYRVVVEGIDANGHVCRQVYRYKVE